MSVIDNIDVDRKNSKYDDELNQQVITIIMVTDDDNAEMIPYHYYKKWTTIRMIVISLKEPLFRKNYK